MNATIWIEGDAIVGEIRLSNGAFAPRGTIVEVFETDGSKIGEAAVEMDGLFMFSPTNRVAHTFRADLGAGHVVTETLGENELPAGTKSRSATTRERIPDFATAPITSSGTHCLETLRSCQRMLESTISQTIQREIRPLRKEMAAYKERTDLHGIIGGIGYICGIFGLGFFLACKSRAGPA